MKHVNVLMRSLAGMMLILSLATPVEAQTSERFPDHVTTFIDNERHEAFDLGGFQELLRIDADLEYLAEVNANLASQVDVQAARILELETALREAEESLELMITERDRLRGMWEEENRLRLEAEYSLNADGVVGWVLAGVGLVATLVLGGVVMGQAYLD